jgi:PAS domain S-box-containing protein
MEPVGILLIDDRLEDLDALELVLQRPDYRFVRARSGEEALRRVLDDDFACILLDVMMPGMDGFEVAKIIKSRPRSRTTPIIFLTALSQDVSSIYRAYSVGAVDYLMKPLDEAVVRAKVAMFVELFKKDLRIQEQAQALVEANRRERELQLAEYRLLSEKRYRALVEMIPASMWTAGPDASVNYCNHRWYEYTGLSPEDSDGDGWINAVHRDDRERIAGGWHTAQQDQTTFQSELRLRDGAGNHRWHMAQIIPEAGRRGEVRGWLGMFTDCEELKRAIEARDDFLSIASHELRTPLSTLVLQLETLKHSLARLPLEEKTRQRLEAAGRQTLRLGALIDSLLDVARICSGRLQIEPRESDLAQIARLCVERLGDESQRAGVEVRLRAPETLRGLWDELRMEQVVTNLLSNAIKYGAKKPIEVVLEPRIGAATLRVSDQGIGIDPDNQRRIFDRFERAVSSRHYGGLGMGLYITRQIVEAHGGTISVQSTPEKGSTFIVELPVRNTGSQAAS